MCASSARRSSADRGGQGPILIWANRLIPSDLCRDSVARPRFPTTYKHAGTAKIPASRTRHHELWVGLWVGKLPTVNPEATIDEVVRLVGGKRVETLLPADDGERPKNADYVFQSENAISELKSLQQDVFTPAYRQKLDQLAQSWMKRNLIRVFGLASLNMRTLPVVCQNEWLRLVVLPLQTNVVSVAHRQIKKTKETLGLPEAKGLLLLANEGNVDFEPHNLLLTIAHILKKKHTDGSPQYSSIHAVSVFSHNLLVSSPDLPNRAFFWLNGHRPFCDDPIRALQNKLEAAWYESMSERVGHRISRVHLSQDQLDRLKFS